MKTINPKQRVLLLLSVIMIALLMPANLAGQFSKMSTPHKVVILHQAQQSQRRHNHYAIPDGWYSSEINQNTEDSIANLVVKVRNNKVVGIKTESGQLLSAGCSEYKYAGGDINCIVKNGKLISAVAVVTVSYPKKRVVYKLTIKA